WTVTMSKELPSSQTLWNPTPSRVQDETRVMEKAHEKLREAFRSCRGILDELAQRPIRERHEKLEERIQDILRKMGEALYEVSIDYRETEKIGQRHISNCEFYFWPGYDSILVEKPVRRITLQEKYVVDGEFHPISAGIGFPLEQYKVTTPSLASL